MSGSKNRSWKILGMGRGKETAAKAEKYLHELGYSNTKIIGVENDKATDDHLIELLKGNDWDAISIGMQWDYFFRWYVDTLLGGGLNGFDDDFPKEITTLHWFNRVVNIVHEHAPKAKFIFVSSPDDIMDSIERVLASQEKPLETV